MSMRIVAVAFTHPDVQRLVADVQAEYVRLYGSEDSTPLDTGVFDPPQGAFFVGYVEEEPVAMGGWRLRSDVRALGSTRSAEVKRMYVAPAARRQGLARAVLEHLEETAAHAGAAVMVLETGTEQPEAIAMYERAGYQRVDGFGYYTWSPKSRCYGKRLVPDGPVSSPVNS